MRKDLVVILKEFVEQYYVEKDFIGVSTFRQKKLLVFLVMLLVQLVIVKEKTNALNAKKGILVTLLQPKIELNAESVL